MNPLAPPKYAIRLMSALAAIAGIFLATGCSSSNSVSPNNNGFNNSNLSGTYVISISGTDVNNEGTEAFFALVGTITADGAGNIQGGTVDINDLNLTSPGVFPGQSLSKSAYNVNQDGRGSGTLITPVGTFGIDFVLTSSSHGLITRFDSGGSGSGTIDIQGSTTQGALTSLAFSLAGVDYSNGGPLGTVGAFTLNSNGNGLITSGLQDFNDDGDSAASGTTGANLGGSLILSSGTQGTAQFDSSLGDLAFDVWVIDSTHLKIIETDTASTGFAVSGDAFSQITAYTPGQLVFAVGGSDPGGEPFSAGGYVTTDVNGNLSVGFEDYNDAGNAEPSREFTGSCNATAPFNGGRCQLAMTGFFNLASFAAYPSSGGVLLLENDSNGNAVVQGTAYAQQATSFTVPGPFGLNLAGANPNGEVDDIAQFNATTATSNNMTGVLDENNIFGNPALIPGTALNGVYTPDTPATGRGSINIPTIGTNNGTLNLEYYVVNAATAIFIDVDSSANNAPQVGVGTFQLQNSSADGPAMAAGQSRISVLHPKVRAHGAFRHK
ncbi:MAG: hypothetical protein ACLPHI_14625 [Terriglobales bacterium]|jgi:hypothetical protein